jgi:hypothetical protein
MPLLVLAAIPQPMESNKDRACDASAKRDTQIVLSLPARRKGATCRVDRIKDYFFRLILSPHMQGQILT